jgi:predicted RNA-binding protein YlxR (DUF448 family)
VTPVKGPSRRRQPQRTCVGCREVHEKRSLTRVVRGPEGIRVDQSGKQPGRGAYVHDQRSCWEKALKGSLERALRAELDEAAKAALIDYSMNLSDEQNG